MKPTESPKPSETVSWELRGVLQDAIEKRFPERQHYRDEVILELMISLVVAYPKMTEGIDLSWDQREEQATKFAADTSRWKVISDVLELADGAVTRYPDDGRMLKRWGHQSPASLLGRKDIDDSAAMDGLNDCATQYCKSEWAKSPTLEQWLVRQMIYAEAYAFSNQFDVPLHYKSFKFWWVLIKSMVKWVVGLGVAFSIGDAYGLAVGVLTYVAWLALVRYLAQDQIDQLSQLEKTFSHMRNAYVLALRSPSCPVEIEKSLSMAEGYQTVWPAGLRSLVEIAIARNRSVWL